jgi:uncharacterized protein
MKDFNEERFTTVFFGGEPLLNWNFIIHAIEKLKQNPLNSGFVMPTNGLLLTPDKIDYLRKNNVNVSLSFDGLWNKNWRVDKEGKSTLDRYMTMFINDEWPGLFQNCKIMVPRSRNPDLVQNYKFFVETIENFYPDFTLVRDASWSKKDVDQFKIEIKELADQTIKYINEGIETLPGIFSLYMLDTIIGHKYGKRDFCCFAGCHGAGFFPSGIVYPCARFGSQYLNPLYDSNVGEAIRVSFQEEVTNPKTFAKCQACELYEFCNGGCTFQQLRYDKATEYGDPVHNVCLLLKECYEQAFRITHVLKYNPVFKKIIKFQARRLLQNG